MGSSDLFITIVAIVPSAFKKDVASTTFLLTLVLIRTEPGPTNFEK
jgi:hypothetical protein